MARVLTMDEVLKLQMEARTRGEYLSELDKFAKSGDVAWDFSDTFPGKEAEAIRNSVNQNIQKHGHAKEWPNLRVMIDREQDPAHCVVVNMELLGSQNGTDPALETEEEETA